MEFRKQRKEEQARLANRINGPVEEQNAHADDERDETSVLYVPDQKRADGKMVAVVEFNKNNSVLRQQNTTTTTSRSESQNRITESQSQSMSMSSGCDESRITVGGGGGGAEADGSTCNLFEMERGGGRHKKNL